MGAPREAAAKQEVAGPALSSGGAALCAAAEEQSRAVLGYWRCPSLATVWGWLGGVFRC